MTKALADELERLVWEAHRKPESGALRLATWAFHNLPAILSALREGGEPVAWPDREAVARVLFPRMYPNAARNFDYDTLRDLIAANKAPGNMDVLHEAADAILATASPVQREAARQALKDHT